MKVFGVDEGLRRQYVRESDVLVLILYLRRLEHARNTHCRGALLLRLLMSFRLLLFEEEVCVVP